MKEKIEVVTKVVTPPSAAELRQRLIAAKLERAIHYVEKAKRLEREHRIAQ